ncbi:mediator of RNA polymerase II transcription subunit 25 [Condylostylus longicornis]|uniref:mediator of RNA polymerase II transcription subunit 25 n=1 Tax=Condylostylus longicornis TaxID=2530218 RepID=UPI00244E4597|nr:mediator of RNA polymerase II transcription subunit 25 [Condylostylus longicornis]
MEIEKMFDVIFVIEGTAINGAYMNDLKTNYLIPALEYFSQSLFEEKEYFTSEKSAMFYGIVLYKTAQSMPNNSTVTYGPFTNPQKVINVLDKLDMAGGGSESNANLAEGLATALCCFDDLKILRHPNDINLQKHCILICNSTPYSMPVLECYQHEGKSVEQLATMFYEKKINFSIISPRKIPILFKLFVKADGDLPLTAKNFCKDPRHLVLLKGFNLKERSSSPNINANTVQSQQAQQMSSISGAVSPMAQNQILNSNVIENSQINSMASSMPNLQQSQGQQQVHSVILTQQQVLQQNHNFNSNIQPVNRWLFQNPPRGSFNQMSISSVATGGTNISANMQQQQQTQIVGNIGSNSNSVLISQLNQPPNAPNINMNQQMQNQMLTPVQQQMRMQLLNQQQPSTAGQQPGILPMQQQASSAQHQLMHQQSQHNQSGSAVSNNAPVTSSNSTNVGNISAEREKVWSGTLEWLEKSKTDQSKSARSVQCQVFANIKDGEVEVKADNWPPRLLMQLMPKHLVGNVGGEYLKDSKVVVFKPQSSESLDALSKIMNNGFAGCVHFNVSTQGPSCDIRILILLYTPEKKTYLGFIPNDQTMFVDQLRKAIQQKQQPCVNTQQQQPQQMQQPSPSAQQLQPQQQPLQPAQQQQSQHQQQQHQQSQQQSQSTQQSSQTSQIIPTGVIGANVNMVGNVVGNSLQQSQSSNISSETNTQQHFNSYNPNQVQLQMQQDQIQNNLQQIGMMQRTGMGGLMQHQGPNAVNIPVIQGVNQIGGPQQQRMVRPMMSNPGLRMLLQQPGAQPGNQFRPQLQQMVGSNPNMIGSSGPSQLPRPNNFEDPNFDFM